MTASHSGSCEGFVQDRFWHTVGCQLLHYVAGFMYFVEAWCECANCSCTGVFFCKLALKSVLLPWPCLYLCNILVKYLTKQHEDIDCFGFNRSRQSCASNNVARFCCWNTRTVVYIICVNLDVTSNIFVRPSHYTKMTFSTACMHCCLHSHDQQHLLVV